MVHFIFLTMIGYLLAVFFFENILEYAAFFFFGTTTIEMYEFFNESFTLFFVKCNDITVIFSNFLHPENASFPILLTFFPIVTEGSFLQFSNAFFSIDVTLYDFPFILIVSGTVILIAFFFAIGLTYFTVPFPVLM